VKLEELMHETIQEECIELKQQLEDQVLVSQNQQYILRENTILKQFPANTQCVYYGKINNISDDGEPLIKFGCSNFLCDRVKAHHKTYDNFSLMHAFKVDNCQQIENAMKYHPVLNKLRRVIKINDIRYTELIAINGELSYENLDGIIKDIIKKIEYSPANYTALLNENEKNLKKMHSMTLEIEKLNRKINLLCGNPVTLNSSFLPPSATGNTPEEPQTQNLSTFKQVKQFKKARDGKYYINDVIYDKLFGTRQEVWDNIAYKTSGDLIKDDLTISQSIKHYGKGKIVSKAKVNMESHLPYSRFTGSSSS